MKQRPSIAVAVVLVPAPVHSIAAALSEAAGSRRVVSGRFQSDVALAQKLALGAERLPSRVEAGSGIGTIVLVTARVVLVLGAVVALAVRRSNARSRPVKAVE